MTDHPTQCHRCGLPLREGDYTESIADASWYRYQRATWCTSIDGCDCQMRQREARDSGGDDA